MERAYGERTLFLSRIIRSLHDELRERPVNVPAVKRLVDAFNAISIPKYVIFVKSGYVFIRALTCNPRKLPASIKFNAHVIEDTHPDFRVTVIKDVRVLPVFEDPKNAPTVLP